MLSLLWYLNLIRRTVNNHTPHLKSPKNQNRRAALGRPAIKLLEACFADETLPIQTKLYNFTAGENACIVDTFISLCESSVILGGDCYYRHRLYQECDFTVVRNSSFIYEIYMPGVTKELHWQGTEPNRYAILTYTHTNTHTHTRVSCKLTAYTQRCFR